jgi:hypothetical protein
MSEMAALSFRTAEHDFLVSLSRLLSLVEGSGGGVSCNCSSARLQAALMASARVEVWLELRRLEDEGAMENQKRMWKTGGRNYR